jgi:hypothetical protein
MSIATLGTPGSYTYGGYGTNPSVSINHTLNAGDNRAAILRVCYEEDNTSGTMPNFGATYDGSPMTLIRHYNLSLGFWVGVAIFVKVGLSGTGSKTFACTPNWETTSGEYHELAAIGTTYTGVHQTTPFRNSGSQADGTSGTATTNVTSVSTDFVVDALYLYENTPTLGANQFSDGSAIGSGTTTDCYGSYEVATGTTTTMSWTFTSTDWIIVAAPLIAAAEEGGTSTIRYIYPGGSTPIKIWSGGKNKAVITT